MRHAKIATPVGGLLEAVLASVLAAVLSAGLTARPVLAQSGEGQVSLAIGAAGPAVHLQDLEENDVSLLDLAGGKPMLIEFWATWCELCKELQPQMDEIQAEYGDRVSVVGVAVAVSQSLRRVRRHVEEHATGYPYLWDGRGAAVRAYEASTTSVVVILDADGKVAYTGVGGGQDLVGAVKRVVGP